MPRFLPLLAIMALLVAVLLLSGVAHLTIGLIKVLVALLLVLLIIAVVGSVRRRR
jgi:uncharacterized membrane protein YtjA (UPF0391 family)